MRTHVGGLAGVGCEAGNSMSYPFGPNGSRNFCAGCPADADLPLSTGKPIWMYPFVVGISSPRAGSVVSTSHCAKISGVVSLSVKDGCGIVGTRSTPSQLSPSPRLLLPARGILHPD